MQFIGLDLSLNSVGIAVVNEKKVIYYNTYLFNKKVNRKKEVKFVFRSLRSFIQSSNCLVIEDVFYNPFGQRANFKHVKRTLRMQGMLDFLYTFKCKKDAIYLMAITARKLYGSNARSHKAEIQRDVLLRENLVVITKQLREIFSEISHQRTLYQIKRINKPTFDKTMGKFSKLINEITGIDEHIADAIVLAFALQKLNELAKQKKMDVYEFLEMLRNETRKKKREKAKKKREAR